MEKPGKLRKRATWKNTVFDKCCVVDTQLVLNFVLIMNMVGVLQSNHY